MEVRKTPKMGKWEFRLGLLSIVLLILMIANFFVGLPSVPFGILVLVTGLTLGAKALAERLERKHTDWPLITLCVLMAVIAVSFLVRPEELEGKGILGYGREMGW